MVLKRITQRQLDSLRVYESKLNLEKKSKLISDLKDLTFNKFKLNDAKTERLIKKFADELFEQHETRDEGTQTDSKGGFIGNHDMHVDIKKAVNGVADLVSTLNGCFKGLAVHLKELILDNSMLLEKSVAMMDFHEAQSQELHELLHRSEEMLQMQVYSSTMNENLINDLLDLAKLENGKFSLYSEPFNLMQTIKAAFHIVRDIAA